MNVHISKYLKEELAWAIDKQLQVISNIQGRRKHFCSGQANQLENCVYTEFRVMSGHKCKLLCEAH